MVKYFMGVDYGFKDDPTCYTLVRGLRWYEKLLRKLRLSKATWDRKVVGVYYEQPTHNKPNPLKRDK